MEFHHYMTHQGSPWFVSVLAYYSLQCSLPAECSANSGPTWVLTFSQMCLLIPTFSILAPSTSPCSFFTSETPVTFHLPWEKELQFEL